MKSLFITGAAGFLGRATIAAALARGDHVRALRRPGPWPAHLDASWRERVAWSEGDVRAPEAWEEALRGADALLHLASLSVGEDAPLRDTNVEGTRKLLAAAARAGVARFVYASSTTVGDGDRDPYAASKREAEALVRASPLAWVIARPTLMVGAGERSMLPRLVERMRAGRRLLVIGHCRIQPVFVEDVAAALVAATDAPDAPGRVFDLAGADAMPFADFLADLARAAGTPPPRLLVVPALPFVPVAALLDACLGGHRFRRRVRYGRRDHVYETDAARALLGFAPEPWRAGLARRPL